MLYTRGINRALAIFALLLGTMLFADGAHISGQAMMPPGITDGTSDDCGACERGSLDTAVCQATCASVALVLTAATVAAPVDKTDWTAAAEADRTGLRPVPDPRPPEHRRLT